MSKGIVLKSLSLLLLLLWMNSSVFAQQMPQIEVTVGNGRVKIHSKNFSIPVGTLRSLEAQIMVDEQLSDLVMADEKRSLSIEGQAVEKFRVHLESDIAKALAEIEPVIKFQLRQSAIRHEPVGFGFTSNSRVIMGSDYTVEENENYDELVVMGGTVQVKGRVGKLVLMQGKLVVHETGIIERELVNMGGKVEIKQGGQVKAQRQDFQFPFSFKFFGNFPQGQDDEGDFVEAESHWFGFLLRFLVLFAILAFWFLGQKFSPNFLSESNKYLLDHGWGAFVWGILGCFLTIPISVLLLISLIGIPLIPIQYALQFCFVVFGFSIAFKKISSVVPVLRDRNNFVQISIPYLLLTVLLMMHNIGRLVIIVLFFMGFGACFRQFFTQLKNKRKQKVAPQQSPGVQ